MHASETNLNTRGEDVLLTLCIKNSEITNLKRLFVAYSDYIFTIIRINIIIKYFAKIY